MDQARAEKRCTLCGETKPLDEFYPAGLNADGSQRYRSGCKSCHRERVKPRSPEEREERLARRRVRWSEHHGEKRKVWAARRREHHFFQWRAGLWSSRWKVRVTAVELAGLWMAQRGRCALTGRKLGRDAHLDHIVPAAAGGSHDIENLRWLDPRVNEARGAMTDIEFVALCQEVVDQATEGEQRWTR